MTNLPLALGLIGYNLFVFLVYGWDKLSARRGWRRVPERTLLLLAALLGSPGALVGMYGFHHKTRKPRFAVGVPLMLAIEVAAAAAARWRGLW